LISKERNEEMRARLGKTNELIAFPPFAGLGDECIEYVKDQVVLVWEDTDLELVSPQGLDSDGTTRWIEVDPEQSEGQNPKDDSGMPVCPWVRTKASGKSSQTMQSKMSVVAQAGAAGLILGQRGIDHLTCQPFGESAEKPKVIWQGSYYGGPEKIQKTSDDFRHDFMLNVGEDERVTMDVP
jgi:hypothetical protein